MFDLDADGFVGVEEAVELFYRRYGREVLFKKDSVKGVATGASKEGERDTSGDTDPTHSSSIMPTSSL